jgi:uncharacterized protein
MSNFILADEADAPALTKTGISPRLRQKLLYMHVSSFDWEQGGLRTPIKFLDRDSIEYSLTQAALHDKNEERMARLSLMNGMALLDQAKGGIYQFATQNCWHQSHYSKTMAAQAGSLRLYSLAYALLKDHCFLQTARNIQKYLAEVLLTPEGIFRSVSAEPVVCIDKYKAGPAEIYTHENAWAIEALATYYEFCGEQSALSMAVRTTEWVLLERRQSGGGFSSDGHAGNPLRLSDNLAVARALLQLYRASTDSRYLQLADDVAMFICAEFMNSKGGFNTGNNSNADAYLTPQIDENICLGRFFNLLHYYTDKRDYLEMARHALRYLAVPQIATSRMEEAGILLLDEELSGTPLKIIIVGDKHAPKASKLHQKALRTFGWYKVIHWQDANTRSEL